MNLVETPPKPVSTSLTAGKLPRWATWAVLSGAHVISIEVLTSQNPNTIAAVIAQNFPEAYGVKTNQLIAGGLVLFVITLVVNAIARLIISRYQEFSGAN